MEYANLGKSVVYFGILNSNPCFRCGKQRIDLKTYTKQVDTTVVTYTDTVCPDPECQKELEKQLKMESAKRKDMLKQKESQAQARLAAKRA